MTPEHVGYETMKMLIAQGRPATRYDDGTDTSCRYRGNNGTKCAAGMWIPDEMYNNNMEDHPITSLVTTYPMLEMHFETLGLNVEHLMVMQRVHDDAVRRMQIERIGKKPTWIEALKIALLPTSLAMTQSVYTGFETQAKRVLEGASKALMEKETFDAASQG